MTISKKILILPLIIAFAILALIFLKTDFLKPQRKGWEKVYIDKNFLWVKIAQTQPEREKGLSGVKSLAQDEGMLFISPQKQQPTFWMKDMNFALDFIWIADNKVVDLNENVSAPLPDTPDNQIATVGPNQPIDMVLEVNSGWVTKHQIKTGDQLLIKN